MWNFLIDFFGELNKCDYSSNLPVRQAQGPEFIEGRMISERLESKERGPGPILLFREGQKKLLDILGYFPETESCKVCDDKLDDNDLGAFNQELGGVVCKKCFLSGHGGILINREDFELLRLNLNMRLNLNRYRRSVLDGMFEYIAGGKFYSLELMNVVR